MDLVTHLPLTDSGYDAICTFVDRFSKYVYFVPCRTDVNAEGVARLFLRTVVCRHGMPTRLISDRDPRFLSHFWTSLIAMLGG
jgi:hypothetical protein